jgi:hypothetical protein
VGIYEFDGCNGVQQQKRQVVGMYVFVHTLNIRFVTEEVKEVGRSENVP